MFGVTPLAASLRIPSWRITPILTLRPPQDP